MTKPDKKILLHMCCAPCGVFPLKYLQEKYPEYATTGYFYNPNIHPYQEFSKRLETLQTFSQTVRLELIVDKSYNLEDFLLKILNRDPQKDNCRICYEVRLKKAAYLAKKEGFDAFTTTLLVSPYQKHEVIKEVAQEAAQEENIEFLYIDFRSGWHEGVGISREMKMYRQHYCGCIFSEKERYCKEKV